MFHSINYADAGTYSVVVSNPCGVVTGYVALRVTSVLQWTNALWNVQSLTNPLMATFGPDLIVDGSGQQTNSLVNAGTTDDFGLPEEGGQVVNVMHVVPQMGMALQVPPIVQVSGSDDSYSIVMDIYQPDSALGTMNTLFATADNTNYVTNLISGGQDGLAFTLDTSNYLHTTGYIAGQPFDAMSDTALPVDAWNRVALVVNNPQDGDNAMVTGYLNGTQTLTYQLCTCCTLQFTNMSLNWTNGSPIIVSQATNAAQANGDLYVSSLQFHAVALQPQVIAQMGAAGAGIQASSATLPAAAPDLSVSVSNGVVNLSWSGEGYVLEETTDLSSGVWVESQLPFTEIQNGSGVTSTVVTNNSAGRPAKFYRLVFRP